MTTNEQQQQQRSNFYLEGSECDEELTWCFCCHAHWRIAKQRIVAQHQYALAIVLDMAQLKISDDESKHVDGTKRERGTKRVSGTKRKCIQWDTRVYYDDDSSGPMRPAHN